jgi:Fungal trichothecene efflux pump (TRI12)
MLTFRIGINTHIASTILVVMTGFIISCATVVSNAMLQLAVPHQYLGVAMGLVTTTRNVGGTIGSTVYTIILSNQLTTHLGTNIATALAKAGLPLADIAGVTGALATGNSMSPALASASPAALGAGILALKLTYVHSFRLIYLISITFGVLGTICAAFTRNVGEYMTNKIDVTISDGAHFGFHDFHEGGHVINHTGEEIVGSRAKAGAQIV